MSLDELFGSEDPVESLKKVIDHISDLPLERILAYVIQTEDYSLGIYYTIEHAIEDPYERALFSRFREEKENEMEYLRKFARKAAPTIDLAIKNGPETARGIEISESMKYVDALRRILEIEELSAKAYRLMARRRTEIEGRFLEEMAKKAEERKLQLERELRALSRKGLRTLVEEIRNDRNKRV